MSTCFFERPRKPQADEDTACLSSGSWVRSQSWLHMKKAKEISGIKTVSLEEKPISKNQPFKDTF